MIKKSFARDRNIVLQVLSLNGNLLRYVPIKFRKDKEIVSAAQIVVELADNAATTAILSASKDGGWATLVSNGSNWVIMQAN